MASGVILPKKLVPANSPRNGLSRLASVHGFRRAVQLAALAFILFIAIRHVVVGESGAIVTASWEAYCPLGGLETLYKYISTGGKTVSHAHLSNLIMFAAAALTALLARNAFCGWICPLGFIQDLTSKFSLFLQRRLPSLRRGIRNLKKSAAGLAVIDRPLRLLKYVVLAWTVLGAAAYGFMVFRDYDPWAALWNLLELSLAPGTIVLAVTLIASFFVERPWCRYACPLGAATGLLGKLSPVYLARVGTECKGCAVCTKACPMGLVVHNVDTIKSADCIGCLECVSACPHPAALELKIGIPIVGK